MGPSLRRVTQLQEALGCATPRHGPWRTATTGLCPGRRRTRPGTWVLLPGCLAPHPPGETLPPATAVWVHSREAPCPRPGHRQEEQRVRAALAHTASRSASAGGSGLRPGVHPELCRCGLRTADPQQLLVSDQQVLGDTGSSAASAVAEGPQHHPDAREPRTAHTRRLSAVRKLLLTQNLATGARRRPPRAGTIRMFALGGWGENESAPG